MRRQVLLSGLAGLFLIAGCSSRVDLTQSTTQQNYGVEFARKNLWREALFRFNRAVEINPQNAMAQNNLAVAYEGIGEFEKARAAYTEALRLDRSNQYIQKNYSRFVEFYTRNKKREKKIDKNDVEEAPKPEADDSSSKPVVPAQPDPNPPDIPSARPQDEPKEPPVTSPPATNNPPPPAWLGGAR